MGFMTRIIFLLLGRLEKSINMEEYQTMAFRVITVSITLFCGLTLFHKIFFDIPTFSLNVTKYFIEYC